MTTTNRPAREYDEAKDVRYESVLDAFTDVFMSPEAATSWRPDYGFMARMRDGQRIREDFRKAMTDSGLGGE